MKDADNDTKVVQRRDCAIAGPEGAPVLVLIHGARLTHAMWQPQIEALSDTFRVIAPDLPGHGALAGVPFSLDAAVEQVATVVDAIDGEHVIVCGLSLGGYVALAFGARYPSRTKALILSGCAFAFNGFVGRLLRAPYLAISRLLTSNFAPLLARAEERTFRKRYPPALADAVVERGFFYRFYPEISAALLDFDPLPALRMCECPVLLLNGAADRFFRRDEQLYLRALRSGRLRLIEGAAHLANLDQPEAYTRALRDFATEIATVQ
jgi:Predicted hydrolases or acyltransferases (alpha/beta hydrolase superfamily)